MTQQGKCCYCETKCEGQIEHYFPQNKYPPQFINEWQNLFLICPACNQNKGDRFEICGAEIQTDDFEECFSVQKPCVVNPEKDFPECMLIFNKEGEISAVDKNNSEKCASRMHYTIKLCKLDRDFLNKERLSILQDLQKMLNYLILKNKLQNINDLKEELNSRFINSIKDKSADYIAFRKFIVNNWLENILNECLR